MALMATLEVRSEEMKKQHAEKMGQWVTRSTCCHGNHNASSYAALIRERDELLVLLDLQERQRYEALRRPSMDDDLPYNNFSAQDVSAISVDER